jgi:hypothetical protein
LQVKGEPVDRNSNNQNTQRNEEGNVEYGGENDDDNNNNNNNWYHDYPTNGGDQQQENEMDGEDREDMTDEEQDQGSGFLVDLTMEMFSAPDHYHRLFHETGGSGENNDDIDKDDDDDNNNKETTSEKIYATNNNSPPLNRSLVLALVLINTDDENDNDAGGGDGDGGGGSSSSSRRNSCRYSAAALRRFQEAARHVQHLPGLRMGVLRLDPLLKEEEEDYDHYRKLVEELLGVDRVPAMLFVTWSPEIHSTVLIEYNGLQSTGQDIAETTIHYWKRLVAATSGLELSPGGEMVHVRPPVYSSLREMGKALATLEIVSPAFASPLFPFPPTMAPGDIRYARWLLAEEEGKRKDGDKYYALPDDSKIFVQCRRRRPRLSSTRSSESTQEERSILESYQLFDQASRALSNRRDCFFAVVQNCQNDDERNNEVAQEDEELIMMGSKLRIEDGSVWGYSVPNGFEHKSMSFATALDPTYLGGGGDSRNNNSSSRRSFQDRSSSDKDYGKDEEDGDSSTGIKLLMHNVAQFAQPSVLWFDRQTTAPIVFGLRQRLHAVLVVDVHPHVPRGGVTDTTATSPEGNNSSISGSRSPDHVPDRISERLLQTRSAVVHFRRQCRRHRRRVACLIVPSTETRVLVTLGVDLWSPLDARAEASRSRNAPNGGEARGLEDDESVLPIAILTDRERVPGKTLVYRLDAKALRSDPEESLTAFFRDFTSKEHPDTLEPMTKSDPRGPRTNAAGVRILTGTSVGELDESDGGGGPPHALILFVASTCGHCKRAVVVWNRLSEFLRDVGWDFVRLYLLDVMENEVPDGVVPRWLPDAYYYRRSGGLGDGKNASFVRFSWIDDDDVVSVKNLIQASGTAKDSSVIQADTDWDVSVLLDWFVDVARLTEDELSSLLDALERT